MEDPPRSPENKQKGQITVPSGTDHGLPASSVTLLTLVSSIATSKASSKPAPNIQECNRLWKMSAPCCQYPWLNNKYCSKRNKAPKEQWNSITTSQKHQCCEFIITLRYEVNQFYQKLNLKDEGRAARCTGCMDHNWATKLSIQHCSVCCWW